MGYHRALAGVGFISLIGEGANPTPVDLSIPNSFTFEQKDEDVELEDENGELEDAYVGKSTVSGKIELSEFSASLLVAASRGVTVAAGSKVGASHTAVIPGTPFTITVPQGATFDKNLAVIDLTTGKRMTRAATATGTGVYAVNETTGVYTFNTADATHSVLIRYRYTAAAVGVTASGVATAAGAAPKFQLHMCNGTAGKNSAVLIPAARIYGLSTAFSKGAWSKTSLDWKAVKSSLNEKFYWYTPE